MSRTMQLAITSGVLLALLLGVLPINTASAQQPQPGAAAPEFTLKDINGTERKLSDFRGKIVVLDFWATWCGPCRSLMKEVLAGVHEQYKDKGLELIGLSNEPAEKQKEFAEANNYHWLKLVDDKNTGAAYGVRGIPQVVVIDREGKIVMVKVGYSAMPDLKEYLAANCKAMEPTKHSGPLTSAQVNKYLKDMKFSAAYEDQELTAVLKSVADRTGVPIKLGAKVDGAKKVSVKSDAGSLEEILKLALADANAELKVTDAGIEVVVKGTANAKPPVEKLFPKGTPEYDKFRALAAEVLPASHRALEAGSVTDAVALVRGMDKEKLTRLIAYKLEKSADAAEKALLKKLSDALK